MIEKDSDMPGQKPRVSNVLIWTTLIVIWFSVIVTFIGIAAILCADLQILSSKTLLIFFGAIFLPISFFSRRLIRILIYFMKK